MRKELIFAIIAGALFGLVIAVGIWRARSVLSPKAESTQATDQSTPSPNPNSGLTIASPNNESVVVETEVVVAGITSPDTFVALSAENFDYLIKSDSKGEFELKIDLIAGSNEIIIKSFPENTNPSEEKLLLVHSTQLAQAPSKRDEEVATDEAELDEVRQKVQEKIDEVLANPVAYIGNVTDITGNTIQIDKYTITTRENDGDILQISVSSATTYASVGKDTETIEFDEVAIGDFIIAMGTTNGADVLDAVRIIVTDTLIESERRIIQGSVKENEDGEITITSGEEELVVEVSRSTDILESDGVEEDNIDDSDIETNDSLIVFFVPDDGEELTRTIYKLII